MCVCVERERERGGEREREREREVVRGKGMLTGGFSLSIISSLDYGVKINTLLR